MFHKTFEKENVDIKKDNLRVSIVTRELLSELALFPHRVALNACLQKVGSDNPKGSECRSPNGKWKGKKHYFT